eukprot:893189_1
MSCTCSSRTVLILWICDLVLRMSTVLAAYPTLTSDDFILVDKVGFTFHEANKYCIDTYQTTLTSISSSDENSIVAGLIQQTSSACSNAHIGLQFLNYQLSWIDGTSISYMQDTNVGSGKECGHIGVSGLWWLSFCDQSWNNVCFVCNAHTPPSFTPTSNPTQPPTLKPTQPPTITPTKPPTLTPTLAPTKHVQSYELKFEVGLSCNDLTNNIDVQYGISKHECIAQCQQMDILCKMVNYFTYFKTSNDSRCYLFDTLCEVQVHLNNSPYDTNRTFIAYKLPELKCSDYPFDWTDNIGDSCSYYETHRWCSDGEILKNEELFYHLMDPQYSLSAIESCCQCGGGITIMYDVGMSRDADWIDLEDILCTWEGSAFKPQSRLRNWDNIVLYDLCDELKDVNCNMLIDTQFNENDYDYSMYLCDHTPMEQTNTNFSFVFDVVINDELQTYDMFINTLWFDLDVDYYSSNVNMHHLNHSKCIADIIH